MTREQMEHMVQFRKELERAIEAFRAVPAPEILSSEEGSARTRLEKALCRLHLVLVTAPASAAVNPPVLH